MKWKFSSIISATALLCVSLTSCKKNGVPETSTSSTTSTESMLMQATNTVSNAGYQQSNDVSDVLGSDIVAAGDSSSCRVVTYSPSRFVYPHLETIDFGNGCPGPDGVTRRGKKLITVYARWKNAAPGTLLTETTFSDFWIDSVNVSGNVKTYIDSMNMHGPIALKIVTNKTFTDNKGNTNTFIAVTHWMQTAGDSTTTKKDNIYQITGYASGSEVLDGATALTWSSWIDPQHPVIKMGDCIYRSSGIEEIKIVLAQGTVFNERLNYGDGDCNNKATLTINNGTPQQVTLPLRFWPISL